MNSGRHISGSESLRASISGAFDLLEGDLSRMAASASSSEARGKRLLARLLRTQDAAGQLKSGVEFLHDSSRKVVRKLTLVTFDYEVMLWRPYVERALGLPAIEALVKEALGLDREATVTVRLLLGSAAPRQPLGLDLLAAEMTFVVGGKPHRTLAQFALSVHASRIGLTLCRGPAFCPESSATAEFQSQVNLDGRAFLTSSRFPSSFPFEAPNMLGRPYSVIVGEAIHLYFSTGGGRHPLELPSDDSVESPGGAVVFKMKDLYPHIADAVAKFAKDSSKDFHHTSAAVRGAPIFNVEAQGVDFTVDVSRKDEGGDHPLTEWYFEMSGYIVLRATFDTRASVARIRQVAPLKVTWIHLVLKGLKKTIVDEGNVPEAYQGFLSQFGGSMIGDIPPVPLPISG